MRPLSEVAQELGLHADDLHPYGRFALKISPAAMRRPRPRPGQGKLVLVSAITPTRAGEGKTTTSIGLGQALRALGESTAIALREPSLGPCMGRKGGGTGGGMSEIVPAERINLHFTGDFHAVTTAHNLLASLLDNHLHHGNSLRIDPRRILWPRVIDLNDRALRHVVLGLGGPTNSVPREAGFHITPASELMAILCLAEDEADLRARIDRTLVAYDYDDQPVTARALEATGAMTKLLQDALMPNLVQTTEGTPAFVHGGPFANIAHGCNSVLATRMALHHADWVVTEAGFGFDLGAEKFFDIKCRLAGLDTAAVVLVATVRALKRHGGVGFKRLGEPDAAAVSRGLPNLRKHIENIGHFGEAPIVAINRFGTDTEEELAVIREACGSWAVPVEVTDHFARGGTGALDLARAVIEHAEQTPDHFTPLYELDTPIVAKIEAVAAKMYGAREVVLTRAAKKDVRTLERLGYAQLPVCIAKTASSLTDDPRRRGRPDDFEITVRRIHVSAGAGFLVVLTGDIMRMPGLSRRPRAVEMNG